MLKRYVIERNIPGTGGSSSDELSEAAARSNDALRKLGPRIQWQHSYVTGDKIFCVYLAEDEDVIREHARLTGIPADAINEVKAVLDPTSEGELLDRPMKGPDTQEQQFL